MVAAVGSKVALVCLWVALVERNICFLKFINMNVTRTGGIRSLVDNHCSYSSHELYRMSTVAHLLLAALRHWPGCPKQRPLLSCSVVIVSGARGGGVSPLLPFEPPLQ